MIGVRYASRWGSQLCTAVSSNSIRCACSVRTGTSKHDIVLGCGALLDQPQFWNAQYEIPEENVKQKMLILRTNELRDNRVADARCGRGG